MRALVLFWLAATLLEATIVSAQEGVVFPVAVLGSGVKYGVLAVLAWPMSRVVARLVLVPLRASVAGHVTMGLVVIAVWQAAYVGFLYLQFGEAILSRFRETAWWLLLNAVLTYAVVAAGLSVYHTSQRLAAEQKQRAELAVVARDAELTSLKAQLRPHFLFNTLNAIYSLIDTKPEEARDMVALLGEMLRATLDRAHDAVVPLRSEVQLTETYLNIEQRRFGDRLRVRIDVPPAAGNYLVPPLILQPLVENAMKHGIAPCPKGGTVQIVASVDGGVLELCVRDTGRGFTDGHDVGRGLDITRRRLRAIYGQQASLSLRNGSPHGGEVHLRIPAATDEPSAPEETHG